jgi:hypothetical protein
VFVKINIISGIILSLIIFAAYALKGSIFIFMTDQAGRISSGNLSTFVLAVPIIIIAINKELLSHRFKLLGIAAILLMLSSALISESRMLITAIVGNAIVVYLSQTGRFKFVIARVWIVVMIAVVIFGCLKFVNNEKINSVTKRFGEVVKTGTSSSALTRNTTNKLTLMKIYKNPKGYGVGAPLSLYNYNEDEANVGNFIDNLPITLIFKFGIFGSSAFLVFYLSKFYSIFFIFRKSNDINKNFAKCILVCLPLFLINSTLYTAQLMYNEGLCAYTLSLLAYFTALRKDIIYAEYKENSK